jgi:dTMP kinase
MQMKKALKIECEGTDGAGKTTALKYLIEKLQDRGIRVLETREVGSPLIPINVKLREVVLAPESNLSGEAMELIFAAMRVENDILYKKVADQYDYIISDRGWYSHLAYTDHNVTKAFTQQLYLNFLQNITDMPDIVIYFDVNTETALQRRVKRGGAVDVIEAKGVGYQELVRQSFKDHMSNNETTAPGVKIYRIDANQNIEGVRAQIDNMVNILTLDHVSGILGHG